MSLFQPAVSGRRLKSFHPPDGPLGGGARTDTDPHDQHDQHDCQEGYHDHLHMGAQVPAQDAVGYSDDDPKELPVASARQPLSALLNGRFNSSSEQRARRSTRKDRPPTATSS